MGPLIPLSLHLVMSALCYMFPETVISGATVPLGVPAWWPSCHSSKYMQAGQVVDGWYLSIGATDTPILDFFDCLITGIYTANAGQPYSHLVEAYVLHIPKGSSLVRLPADLLLVGGIGWYLPWV